MKIFASIPASGRRRRPASWPLSSWADAWPAPRSRGSHLLDRPAAVARYLALRYGHEGQEVMGAFYLSGSQRLIAERVHFRGTMTRAAVEPRQIFEVALQCRAVCFVLFHTHPSGDPTPSAEDLAFTRRMADAGEVLCVALADHLIIGMGDRWTSLRQWGAW